MKIVKAGEAGKVILSDRKTYDEINIPDTFTVENCVCNKTDYEIFIVVGESLAPENIHTNDLLLVPKASDKVVLDKLETGDIIIFRIDLNNYKKRYNKELLSTSELGYKVRKYLCYTDLTLSKEAAFQEVVKCDEISDQVVFYEKYQQAKDCFKQGTVLISITYTPERRDYSIHLEEEYYRRVKYIKQGTVYSSKKILPIEKVKDSYKENVAYTSLNRINVNFYTYNVEQEAIVMVYILKYSREVKMVPDSSFPDLFENPLFQTAWQEFFMRENTSMEILLYAGDSNMQEKLKDYMHKNITIQELEEGFAFKWKNRTIHFVTGDEDIYRMETNPQKHEAVCNFCDSQTTKKLVENFDQVFKH